MGLTVQREDGLREKKGLRTSTAVTIQDVAQQVGVSKTTAACILRNAPNFQASEATRVRVIEAAKSLGYRRHSVAAALSSGRTNTVGLILPLASIEAKLPVSRIYGQDIFVAVFQAASRVGLRVTAIPMTNKSQSRLRLHDVTDRSVDGVVMASMSDAEFVHEVYEAGIVCVEIGSGYGKHLIHPDNEGGAEAAVTHLVELGHRRIVHWAGAGNNYAAQHRRQGFSRALSHHGLDDRHAPVLFQKEEVVAELKRSVSDRPTAIFAYNDYQATVVLDIARELNLRVPEDLSVVGFDDNILAEAARPQLTTISNPLSQQADAAIKLLQALWSGEDEQQAPYTVPTRLIVRHSTTAAPVSNSRV